eukprot:scaffold136509_cov44-Attheya_sp.AAC.1
MTSRKSCSRRASTGKDLNMNTKMHAPSKYFLVQQYDILVGIKTSSVFRPLYHSPAIGALEGVEV